MRSVRTLATGAAVAATLLLSAPLAVADAPADHGSPSSSGASGGGWEEHAKSDSSEPKHQKPHGGVHTGGGGLALSGGGLASGAVLLAGGIGVSAYAVRRRRTAAPAGLAV